MAGLIVRNVTKQFGSTTALDDVSIEVEDGSFLVLLGPSGCGKTTLLRIIAGLLGPTSGQVAIGDREVTDLPPRSRDIAMVFQSYALYPHLSVEKNLGFGLRMRRRPKEEIAAKVRAVAEQLQLDTLLARKPKELSGGQRQRVALGRAMVRDPAVFLMDEPLSNLDAQLRTATRLELADLHRRLGTTFVYVTHDQVEAMTMGTTIVVMNGGRVEQIGSPAEVYDEPASSFVAGFIGAPPMALLDAVISTEHGTVHVRAPGVDIPLWEGTVDERAVRLGVRPEHLRVVPEDDGGPTLRGEVAAIENLGSEEVAFVAIGDEQVAVRGPRPLHLEVDQTVVLSAPPSRIYLFDPVSTRRLVWVDEAATGARSDQPAIAASTEPALAG